MKCFIKNIYEYAKTLIKWVFFASLIGVIGGFVGSIFHESIETVTHIRELNPDLIYALPFGGLLIVLMYRLSGKKGKIDTNRVIEGVSKDEKIPFVMSPLIFISSAITHLFGGSAGREGAALQLGGSIAYSIAKIFKISKNDVHTVIMTGMSALFAAVFGTPITASIFAIEIITVGTFHYRALFPCVISAIIAQQIARKAFRILPSVAFKIPYTEISPDVALKVCLITAICALISIFFCWFMKKTEYVSERLIKNTYLRVFVGGIIIIFLTLLCGSQKYNGAGVNIIEDAFNGNVKAYTFLIKILFTAITIAVGFKGGEIVPAFAIGSALGCVLGQFFGIHQLGTAVGFITLFCSITNCPIASLFLGIEVFGTDNILMFALTCALSYIISGNTGLYKSQKIIYSKTTDELIDINVK